MSEIKENRLYFVKDEFFDNVQDAFLKMNKEDSSRPHYFPFIDNKTGLYWLIPCSSRIEKYQEIIENKKAKNKPHNHIQIIKVNGREEAFLYQDMFPVLPKYISDPYKNKYGIFEVKNETMIEQINENAVKIIKLLRHGLRFTPTQPNVLRIEKLMLEEQKSDEGTVGEMNDKIADNNQ